MDVLKQELHELRLKSNKNEVVFRDELANRDEQINKLTLEQNLLEERLSYAQQQVKLQFQKSKSVN